MNGRRSMLLRVGRTLTITAADKTVLVDSPDIYGHVDRLGFLYWDWEITAGETGEPLQWGTTLTEGGAWLAATAAAHRPRPADEVIA